MYLTDSLQEEVFEKPYNQGYRELTILSGYASPLFTEQVMLAYPALRLELIIGMTSHEGIEAWNHSMFCSLVQQYPALKVSYQVRQPGNHRKAYYWKPSPALQPKVFMGSANFTLNGFNRQRELLVEAAYDNIEEIFSDIDSIPCNDSDAKNHINVYKAIPQHIILKEGEPTEQISSAKDSVKINRSNSISILSIANKNYTNYVDIPLIAKKYNDIAPKSGLNWGQRITKGQIRNHDEAYIAVSATVHKRDPFFFPERDQTFLMATDDGEILICTIAQAGRKAIQTRDNSLLGRYFRKRLGTASGAYLSKADLERYGRTSVRIYKIDDETYFLDFSV